MNVSLKVKIFDQRGTRIVQVPRSTLTIGSAAHCDVVLDHPTIAAEHARAWLEGGRIWLQDLGSAHGTALNDVRLPGLKPMLVRDVDILKLGECDATIGLEALLVRAPVVNVTKSNVKETTSTGAHRTSTGAHRVSAGAKTPVSTVPSENTQTDIKTEVRDVELSKRREEAEALGRELAELRLQLQMAHLEKSSSQELSQQLNNLKEEIKTIQEQKGKWNETLRQMEAEKQAMRKTVETELAEFKVKSLAELKALRDKDAQRIEVWKGECIVELKNMVRALSVQKTRAWATRPISNDMLLEWEADLNTIFRRVILNESGEFPQFGESTPALAANDQRPPQAPAHTPPSYAPEGRERSHTPIPGYQPNAPAMLIRNLPRSTEPTVPSELESAVEERPRSSRTRTTFTRRRFWRSLTFSSFLAVVILIGLWYGISYFRGHGSRALSSQMPPPPVAASQTPPAPEKTSRPLARFEPKQGKKYRGSYTDNVLYLENYVAAEENIDFRKRWMTDLNKVAGTDWKVDPWTITALVAKEQVLVQDLNRIKDGINPEREQDGIKQMRAREAQFIKELESSLKNRAYVDRFLKYKRAFYMRNQAYLAKTNY